MPVTGRPRILDETRCSEVCDLIASGHSLAAVARIVGCNVKTITRHARRDDAFRRSLGAAELAARNDPLKLVRRAANGSWRAAAWLLERTDPARYGKHAAPCKPEHIRAAFARLIESAIAPIADETRRRDLYRRLSQVAEQETLRLFLPPALQPQTSGFELTPAVDQQRLHDFLDAATDAYRPASPRDQPKSQTADSPKNSEDFPPSRA